MTEKKPTRAAVKTVNYTIQWQSLGPTHLRILLPDGPKTVEFPFVEPEDYRGVQEQVAAAWRGYVDIASSKPEDR